MRRTSLLVAVAVLAAGCASTPTADTPTTSETGATAATTTSTTSPTTTAAGAEPCTTAVEAAVIALGELVQVYADAQTLDQASAEFADALARLETLDNETQQSMAEAAALGCDDATVMATIEEAAAPIDALFAGQFDEPVRRSALQAWLALNPATVEGDALPPFQQGSDPAIGLPIPSAASRDLAGAPMEISLDGRPKAIMFVAHWCPHCRDEVAEMAPWIVDADIPGDVELITVATGTDPTRDNYPPAEWFAAAGWPDPVFDDRGNVTAEAFGLTAYPFWVFVDSDGLVVSRSTGALGLGQIIAMLDTLSAS